MKLATTIAGAIGGLMMLGASAQALPVAPVHSGPGVELTAMGCGPGWTRTRWGRCAPMARPMMRPARCWMQRTPYGMRRVCRR